ADSLFAQVADQTAEQARAHVGQATPAVDTLTGLLARDSLSEDELARRMLLVLRANPGFSWVSFSDPRGAFTGAQRSSDGALLLNRSSMEHGKTVMDEFAVDSGGRLSPRRHEGDTGYDPRLRPFYRQAIAARARVWTDPYVFYDEGIPGITCASPVYGADGELRGVLTVDFDLNALSAF